MWYTSTRCRACYNIKCQRNNVAYTDRTKERFLDMYGRKCACPGCDQNNPAFLVMDHVNDDGAAHRMEVGGSRTATKSALRDAIKQYQPDRFQTLCANCNMAKGRHSCEDIG